MRLRPKFDGAKPRGAAAGKVGDLASSKVKWVDENAGMSSGARYYNDSATGARSNPATQSSQAHALERTMPDGSTGLIKLYQNSTAVEVPRDVHIAGPTYGGKNTPAKIQQDAADLCGAVCRDTEALRANLNSRGYDSKLVDETVQKIVERNRNTGAIK